MADSGEGWREFVRQNPQWREALKRVCALKLEIARADYVEADERVRRELSDEVFRETEVLAHPRLRRRSQFMAEFSVTVRRPKGRRVAHGVCR
jgi:hypothetical protein